MGFSMRTTSHLWTHYGTRRSNLVREANCDWFISKHFPTSITIQASRVTYLRANFDRQISLAEHSLLFEPFVHVLSTNCRNTYLLSMKVIRCFVLRKLRLAIPDYRQPKLIHWKLILVTKKRKRAQVVSLLDAKWLEKYGGKRDLGFHFFWFHFFDSFHLIIYAYNVINESKAYLEMQWDAFDVTSANSLTSASEISCRKSILSSFNFHVETSPFDSTNLITVACRKSRHSVQFAVFDKASI